MVFDDDAKEKSSEMVRSSERARSFGRVRSIGSLDGTKL